MILKYFKRSKLRLKKMDTGGVEKISDKLQSYYYTDNKYFEGLEEHFDKNNKIIRDIILPLVKEANVIFDSGCGTGVLVRYISQCFPKKEVYGMDISPLGINIGKQKAIKYHNCKLILGDIVNTGFENGKFDLIISYQVVEHIIEPEKLFKEIYRLLKPDGKFYISFPNLITQADFGLIVQEITTTLFLLLDKCRITYLEPDLLCTACGDRDAVWLTNPFKIMYMLKSAGFIIQKKYGLCHYVCSKGKKT